MQRKSICVICGKKIECGSNLCYQCDEEVDENSKSVDYQPDQELICSSLFGQTMFSFFKEFFSRNEVLSAFEESIGSVPSVVSPNG